MGTTEGNLVLLPRVCELVERLAKSVVIHFLALLCSARWFWLPATVGPCRCDPPPSPIIPKIPFLLDASLVKRRGPCRAL